MQKSMLALLMVAGATAATNAGAEENKAFKASVYGVGHLSLDSSDGVADEDVRLASNSSRIGARASYALTPGLSLLAQYEQGLDLTNVGANDGNGPGDTSNVFTRARDSFVGIKSPYGTVKFGRQGLLNAWVYDVNFFADQVGDLGNIWGGTGFAGRGDNTVSYETPNFSGLSGILLYTESPSDTPDDEIVVAKANYQKGPLTLGAAYGSASPQLPSLEDHKITALTASYRLDGATAQGIDISGSTLGIGFQSEEDIRGVAGNDRTSFTLGGVLKVNGRHAFKAQYTNSDADAADADASQFAIGYDFAWRDDVTLYAAYARTENDPLAAFTANNYGHGKAQGPDLLGGDPATFSVGAIFSFDCSCTASGAR